MSKAKRFLIAFTGFTFAICLLLLVYHEQWGQAWTVMLGAAYLWIDRIEEKHEDNNHD
jgi:4-hydroxybenzoate polyprenyltransferase